MGFVATMLIAVTAAVLAGAWVWIWRDLITRLGWAGGWVFAPIGVAFLAGTVYVLVALFRTRRESSAEHLGVETLARPRTEGSEIAERIRTTERALLSARERAQIIEAELRTIEQAPDGPAKRVAESAVSRRLSAERMVIEDLERSVLESRAILHVLEAGTEKHA